ncbi:MAG TPA: ATP-grasp domain-containing protein [Gaiellaceae bacterium]|nr:ATP-grasp domain-containing protein [Gaiellaceae bacterium]
MGISATKRQRRLLVLGAGPAQLGLLRAARDRGLFVVACDRDARAPGFEYADRRAIVSAEDEPAIGKLAQAEGVDGVIAPGIDWPVAIAARVAARFALPHPLSPETASLAVSKLRQRERLKEAGVPQPDWEIVTEADGLTVPCVVKPPDRQGQKGLTLVRDHSDLEAAVELAVAESRAGCALVEGLVEGPEVTVNGFSAGGVFHPLTVTDRLTAEPPAFGVALAHAWPSEHDVSEAVEAARTAAEAVGIENGPTYTQVRLSDEGARVMELAARLGGGHDAEVCREALGVDPNQLALDAALGEPVDVPEPSPAGGACVRFLVPPEGELTALTGIDEARAADGVVDARVYRRPGWVFGPLRRGADRAGFVLARGDSRDDALAKAGRAADLIRFESADAAVLQQT